jgi:hypothetical protein
VNLEREVKLTVGPLFHLPDLSEVLDGFSAEGEGVQRFVTSYYDTQELRLARWGCSLRYRTGDGWTVKLPATAFSDTLAREEHHFEAGPGRPPAPAIDLLRDTCAKNRSHSRCSCRRVRRPPAARRRGQAGAEVVDDEVSVLDGRRVVARFRELEAELTRMPTKRSSTGDRAVGGRRAQRAEPACRRRPALMPLAAARVGSPASGPRPSKR